MHPTDLSQHAKHRIRPGSLRALAGMAAGLMVGCCSVTDCYPPLISSPMTEYGPFLAPREDVWLALRESLVDMGYTFTVVSREDWLFETRWKEIPGGPTDERHRRRARIQLARSAPEETIIWLCVDGEQAGAAGDEPAEAEWIVEDRDTDMQDEIVYRTRKKLGAKGPGDTYERTLKRLQEEDARKAQNPAEGADGK